jgi:hypothetical protein
MRTLAHRPAARGGPGQSLVGAPNRPTRERAALSSWAGRGPQENVAYRHSDCVDLVRRELAGADCGVHRAKQQIGENPRVNARANHVVALGCFDKRAPAGDVSARVGTRRRDRGGGRPVHHPHDGRTAVTTLVQSMQVRPYGGRQCLGVACLRGKFGDGLVDARKCEVDSVAQNLSDEIA